MKEKHILLAAIVLFGLAVYYAIFEYETSTDTSRWDVSPHFLVLDYRAVKKIHIKTHEGKELIAERKEMDWQLIKGTKAEKWKSKIADIVLYLISAPQIDKVLVETSQLGDYGLENPTYRITLTDITDKTYQLAIGDHTPGRTSEYVKFADSPYVVIVGALMNWELTKLKPLLTPS